jgi:hypothetical protein
MNLGRTQSERNRIKPINEDGNIDDFVRTLINIAKKIEREAKEYERYDSLYEYAGAKDREYGTCEGYQKYNKCGESEEKVKLNCTFNEIDFVVSPDTLIDDIVEKYNKIIEKKTEAYKNSNEGITAIKEYKEKIEDMQEKTDKLIENLSSLDFSDYESVLEWLSAF